MASFAPDYDKLFERLASKHCCLISNGCLKKGRILVQRKEIDCRTGGPVILIDSITQLSDADIGAIIVSGSHGGTSSADFALQVPIKLVFFNDAGGGKDGAGIAALAMLQDRNIACAAVAHISARIGDAADMWENGLISHVNAAAKSMGLHAGVRVRSAVSKLVELG